MKISEPNKSDLNVANQGIQNGIVEWERKQFDAWKKDFMHIYANKDIKRNK